MARVTAMESYPCPVCLREDVPAQGRRCQRCRGDLHPEDTLIRSVGFAIQRRGSGVAVWRTPTGSLVVQGVAVEMAREKRGN